MHQLSRFFALENFINSVLYVESGIYHSHTNTVTQQWTTSTAAVVTPSFHRFYNLMHWRGKYGLSFEKNFRHCDGLEFTVWKECWCAKQNAWSHWTTTLHCLNNVSVFYTNKIKKLLTVNLCLQPGGFLNNQVKIKF